MRHLLLPALLLGLSAVFATAAQGQFFLRDGDRLVFYGDSITDTEWYPTLVESYVLTRYPRWRNEYLNRGQSGDNGSNLERFARDVLANKPSVFTYMMGYNDGGYAPLTSATLERFVTAVGKSVAMARAQDPKVRIMLVSPTPNETAVSSSYPRWVTHDGYPYTLLSLAREESKLAQRLGVGFVDMTLLYGQTMGFGQVMAQETFRLSRDGVHPQQEGQTFIAYHLLRGLGADPLVASVVLDAAGGKVAQAERCKVSEVRAKQGTLSFTRLCESLPYPTPEVARPFSFLVDLDNTLNRDMLTVRGLTAPAYRLSIDREPIADLPAESLAQGVNLSTYPGTPMYRQALEVMQALRQRDLLDCGFWRQYVTTKLADGAGKPLGSDTVQRAEVEAARKGVADALQAAYALNTPRVHRFTLEPLPEALDPYAPAVASDWNQSFLVCTATPVPVDWNKMALLGSQVEVKVQNPGQKRQEGTITWHCPAGWQVEPARADFVAEPGKTASVAFRASCPQGKVSIPPPAATVRWAWTGNWAYPRQSRVEMELAPRLTVPRAKVTPGLSGRVQDWQDAVAFTLDSAYFVDPAVPGKRALWNGPDDLSATFFLKWDEQRLYLGALVHDDAHVQSNLAGMMWAQDCLHVAFWLEEPGQPAGRYEYGFALAGQEQGLMPFMASPAPAADAPAVGYRVTLEETQGTCFYEAAFPWARLAPFVPAGGRSFRFGAVVGEGDPQLGKGYNYLAWTHGISYGKNPMDLASLVLEP